MSRPVHERLKDLETDVRDLRMLPAAAVRARGRRRGRRQLAALAVAGAVVATTAGIAATNAFERPDQRTAAAGRPDQPTAATEQHDQRPAIALNCVLALPDSPAAVRVRVLDGGAPGGLPKTTAAQLRTRQFTVVTGTGTGGGDPADVATLRYGPAAIGSATVLRAMVHGEVRMVFDPNRRDAVIDLTVGPAFTRLATTTEVNQGLAAAGEPSAPPQC